jgi:hypothetical protein
VHALVQPRVTHVGRLILDRPPGLESFATNEDAVMSVTVGCSTGVEDHSEIGSGIAVFDAVTGVRKKHVPCSYTVERHPSGRFRFKYRLSELGPGAYKVRIAFAIHESGHEPSVVEALFGVHAAAGYVPPKEELEPRAISLEARRNDSPTAVTEARRSSSPSRSDDQAPEPVEPPQHGEVARGRGTSGRVHEGRRRRDVPPDRRRGCRAGRRCAAPPCRGRHPHPRSVRSSEIRIDDRPTRPSIPASAGPRAVHPSAPMLRPRRADEDTWDSSDWEAILGPDGGNPWPEGPSAWTAAPRICSSRTRPT